MPEATPRPHDDKKGDDAPAEAGSRSFLRRLLGTKRRIAIVGSVTVIAIGGLVWLATKGPSISPQDLQRTALAQLDAPAEDLAAALQQVRDAATKLEELGHREDDFVGAIEFLRGIAAFREAREIGGAANEQAYLTALRHLREAESRGLVAERRPEWAFAMGSSLYHVGSATEARPRLEEAVETYGPGRIEASLLLTDAYLDLKDRSVLDVALRLNDDVSARKDLTTELRDRASLQRALILLGLGRDADAEGALRRLSPDASKNHGTIVSRAQLLLADRKYREALASLDPVANDPGLDQTDTRQASYLMGLAAQELGDSEAAVLHFERTAQKYEQTQEGIAASLRAALLLRRAGRHEEALEAYRRALRQVRTPDDFRNRWLDLAEFRKLILDAWNEWNEDERHAEAIQLSRMMTPLLSDVQANELTARANQRWAESLEKELETAPIAQRADLTRRVRDRWIQSGRAYADLSDDLRSTSRYAGALWISSEHFRRGHDYDAALAQVTRYIDTNPEKEMPLALVRRGVTLLDLGRLDEALEHFQRVTTTYPTAPAAFEAAYLTGLCRLERNEQDDAESAWRQIVESDTLTPDAIEWRSSLFQLGRLQYHRATRSWTAAANRPGRANDAEAATRTADAFARWDESVRRLEEFLKRYPKAPETDEARYLLARALQQSAEQPRRKLQAAETENARGELRRQMRNLLQQSIAEQRRLQQDLLKLDETERLDDVRRRFLQDCYFEIAHAYYALERYDEAIVAYGGAANRYSESPQVLVAYVQMTDCYDRLGKPSEARSMIQQAKVILNQMPDSVFRSPDTNMTRDEWRNWLEWARRLHQSHADRRTAES